MRRFLCPLLAATASHAYQLPSLATTTMARALRTTLPRMGDDDFADVKPSTVFMFPGQGAQVVGMGAEAAKEVPAAAELYAKASEILGYDLLANNNSVRVP